ncbi:hypothetical protein V8E54_008173 [Elaphomyces granulatus]
MGFPWPLLRTEFPLDDQWKPRYCCEGLSPATWWALSLPPATAKKAQIDDRGSGHPPKKRSHLGSISDGYHFRAIFHHINRQLVPAVEGPPSVYYHEEFSFGIEIETLLRPKFVTEVVRDMFEAEGWNFQARERVDARKNKLLAPLFSTFVVAP